MSTGKNAVMLGKNAVMLGKNASAKNGFQGTWLAVGGCFVFFSGLLGVVQGRIFRADMVFSGHFRAVAPAIYFFKARR